MIRSLSWVVAFFFWHIRFRVGIYMNRIVNKEGSFVGDVPKRAKYYYDPCLPMQTGPQSMIVRQVIGEREKQKVLDLHICVPHNKPAIEQIVDVFVKDVEVSCIDVITDRVIVRGELEVKAIYVACLPDQPVHAIEVKHYKWTQDIDIPGARRGMDADAGVVVEFVDYDVEECSRAYKHKYGKGKKHKADSCSTDSDLFGSTSCTSDDYGCELMPMPPIAPCPKPPKPSYHCDTPPHYHDTPCHSHHCDNLPYCDTSPSCTDPHYGKPHPCKPPKPHHHHKPHHYCDSPTSCSSCDCTTECLREFDVSIVLRITAKVLADREVQMNLPMPNQQMPQPTVQNAQPQQSGAVPPAPMPENPKG